MSDIVTINRPFDAHLHVRQGEGLKSVVPMTARQFGNAIIMPNTMPFILNTDDAARYRDEILAAVPSGVDFTPLMTLYLQTTTSPDTIRAAKKSGIVYGMKMYPAGATTNSEGGVVNIMDVEEQLRVMEEVDMPLLIHGESADPNVDVFYREDVFYEKMFPWIPKTFPKLRVVCEHITTKKAVEVVERASLRLRIGATITVQHMVTDRNYMLGGPLRPHANCKPILKRLEDQEALLAAATSGNPRFFLGTDSAPHPRDGLAGKAKEVDCGCAGCFTSHAAMEMYAEAFYKAGALSRLEDFSSKNGLSFYNLPRNRGELELVRESWQAPESYEFGEGVVVPFMQEIDLRWKKIGR